MASIRRYPGKRRVVWEDSQTLTAALKLIGLHSVKDVAAAVGVSPATIRDVLHRGRKAEAKLDLQPEVEPSRILGPEERWWLDLYRMFAKAAVAPKVHATQAILKAITGHTEIVREFDEAGDPKGSREVYIKPDAKVAIRLMETLAPDQWVGVPDSDGQAEPASVELPHDLDDRQLRLIAGWEEAG